MPFHVPFPTWKVSRPTIIGQLSSNWWHLAQIFSECYFKKLHVVYNMIIKVSFPQSYLCIFVKLLNLQGQESSLLHIICILELLELSGSIRCQPWFEKCYFRIIQLDIVNTREQSPWSYMCRKQHYQLCITLNCWGERTEESVGSGKECNGNMVWPHSTQSAMPDSASHRLCVLQQVNVFSGSQLFPIHNKRN